MEEDELDDFADDYCHYQSSEDNEEYLNENNGSFMRYIRSPINANESTDITIMNLDVDYYIGKKLLVNTQTPQSAIIRIYGVTLDGNSVLFHIHDFLSYCYIMVPPSFEISSVNIEGFKSFLNYRLAQSQSKDLKHEVAIQKIEVVQKESIMYFKKHGDQRQNYFKIYTVQPQQIPTLRTMFERGLRYLNYDFPNLAFEANMPYVLRFMIDAGMVGVGWITAPAGKFTIRDHQKCISRCQIEVDISYQDIVVIKPEGTYAVLAPLRFLSIDIECLGTAGFPTPDKDKIITIACTCKVHTNKEEHPKIIFQLGSCSNIPGVDIRSFQNEVDLLKSYQDFLLAYDPDFIIGYNIVNFDLPYILRRGEALKIPLFGYWGRILKSPSKIKKGKYLSKVMGMRETDEMNIEGRIQLDLLIHMMKETKLSSYSLNNVSFRFLGDQKEDVQISIMAQLFHGTEETRKRIASYCLKDSALPLRLTEKLMCLYNYAEMARVTGVPLNYLFTRGQQIKVASQLYRKAAQCDMIIPSVRGNNQGGKFEGAFVLAPKVGFYKQPIATLDFASLYPSIMIAHNLCFSTLIHDIRIVQNMKNGEEYTATPTQPQNYYFVTPSIRKGLLPMILEELLEARKKARAELAKTNDEFLKAVFDGRQLALKISANSVYGFTGAQKGQLPCIPISSSVTAFGRTMIEKTRDTVLDLYSKAKGYDFDSEVIYGDTDSVMVKFGVSTVEEAMKLGKDASVQISKYFKAPIKLEFEKVYYPYLLLKKKHYAGLFWTKPEKYDKLDTKGLETVRRDNCLLLRTIMANVLNKLLIQMNVQEAIDYVRSMIADLLQNKFDLSYLVISRAISKKINSEDDEEEQKSTQDEKSSKNSKNKTAAPKNNQANHYKSRMAHVELAEKMRKRDPANAPNIGDRIPYVIICGSQGSKNYENSEDPLYVMEKDLPIDFQYYLEKQIKPPILRIFSAILPNPESIFHGDHTKNVIQQKTSSIIGIGKYAQSKSTCFNCKIPVVESKVFCEKCLKNHDLVQDVYLRKLFEFRGQQQIYGGLWTECQRCQGNLHADVLCSNRDCPIFYKRKKVQKDIKNISELVAKFSELQF